MRNPWIRQGFFYICTKQYAKRGFVLHHTKKLDFISYHLIKWLHGEEELLRMAERA
jgi:hypothetical protein